VYVATHEAATAAPLEEALRQGGVLHRGARLALGSGQ